MSREAILRGRHAVMRFCLLPVIVLRKSSAESTIQTCAKILLFPLTHT